MSTTYPVARETRRKAGRYRIRVGGIDVTFLRGVQTPEPGKPLIEPFAYGATSLTFPQVNAAYEVDRFGQPGDLEFVRAGARVVFSRVFDDERPEKIDYVGRVEGIRPGGDQLALSVGGEFTGPAATIDQQPQMFRYVNDVGHWAHLIAEQVNLSFTPWGGPATGIDLTHAGGQSHLSWAQYVCAMSQDEDGVQRTLMPSVWGGNTWVFAEKDYTTKDLTLYHDDSQVVLSVADDITERANVIYGTGVTPGGERVTNAKWPNVFIAPPPPYPMEAGADFGIGTTDADTINDDGITLLWLKLREVGYIKFKLQLVGGTYSTAIANGVKKLQDDAGLMQTGEMSKAAWKALYDPGIVGYHINGAYIAPLAEDPRVRKWNRAANGAIIGRNPLYDATIPRVERSIDFGPGVTKAAMIGYARAILAKSLTMKNWTGTIRLNGVGGFAGEHDATEETAAFLQGPDGVELIMGFADIRPGMNVWLPLFDGGTLFHVSGNDIDPDGATLTVDTQARDLVEVRQIIARNVEARRDIRRDFYAQNRPRRASADMVMYDEGFGIIDRDVRLKGGQWNLVPVITGQHGQVNRTRLRLVKTKPEFAALALSRHKTSKKLEHKIGNPLVVADESWLEKESLQGWFDDDTILWGVGTGKEPCGYSPRRKLNDVGAATGAPKTGRLDDSTTWSFIFAAHTAVIVFLAIYPENDCTLKKGRILFPQLDAAA